MDNNADAPLPSYLMRHINLGFDCDDVAALLSAIDSSQSSDTATLPQLPAELLFHIVEYVPIDYILDWRLICRGFRDAIDGPVMFEYLKQAELIGYLGTHSQYPLHELDEEQYERAYLLRAHFDHIINPPATSTTGDRGFALWSGNRAVFRIQDRWFKQFPKLDTLYDLEDLLNLESQRQVRGEELCFGSLRWCLRLNTAVLDLAFPMHALQGSIEVVLEEKTVSIEWRDLVFRFLKVETFLRTMMEQKYDSLFTFGHQEDCLRAVRRHFLRTVLDMDNKDDRITKWAINLLPPLFAQPRSDVSSSVFQRFERAEDEAIQILTLLRREAAMSAKEIAGLHQLAEDRKTMSEQLQSITELFGEWGTGVFQAPLGLQGFSTPLPPLPLNPLAWSDSCRAIEEARVRRWKFQKKTIEQITLLMKGSMDALTVPENAFDTLGSDF